MRRSGCQGAQATEKCVFPSEDRSGQTAFLGPFMVYDFCLRGPRIHEQVHGQGSSLRVAVEEGGDGARRENDGLEKQKVTER